MDQSLKLLIVGLFVATLLTPQFATAAQTKTTSFLDFIAGLFDTTIHYTQTAHAAEIVEAPVFTLGFVGDIMMDRSVAREVERSEKTYRSFFSSIESELQSYDVLFGNLEGPVSDKGVNQGSIYSFRMHPKVVDVLDSVGFDIFSVANNHAYDWGLEAFRDTLNRLDEAGIQHVGGGETIEDAYKPKFVTLSDGTVLAYLAMSSFGYGWMDARDQKPGIAITDIDYLEAAIPYLKKKVDIVIVSLHQGEEYATIPSKKIVERNKRIIDAGADLVVGHHPHVLQPVEKYKEGYIAYSMGNFLFDQTFSYNTMVGGVLEADIQNGQIKSLGIKTTYQDPSLHIRFVKP